jgi:hypothetical protein
VQRLTREPFDAPDANELAALGLTAGHLATAVRLGALLAVGAGVYLLPTAPTEAARRVAGRRGRRWVPAGGSPCRCSNCWTASG